MRIISGIFKGKKILEPKDLETRPLKDLTKESIFNIIKHSHKLSVKLDNSIVLDLFSGVGSFGLECLSRGSGHVTFVENYKKVLPILKKNLLNLKMSKKFTVLEKDISKNFNFSSLTFKYDIIFLDPPYKFKNISEILFKVYREKILKPNGIVVIHRHKREMDQFSSNFKILEIKNYGISKVIFGLFLK